MRKGHIFPESDPLIHYLERERTPLDIERVKEWAESGGPKNARKAEGRKQKARYDFGVIRRRMEELQAACCVPSFLGERLRNVLILGEKKSGDFYSDEDLSVLYTLAQESAIAIENARLYDQAIEKAKELEAINDELNTAQTNLLRALDETEVANKKLRDTHAQLIHEQKMATLGRLASSVGHEVNNPLTILSMNVSRAILKYRQDPNLKVGQVMEIFQKMEQNISRIKAVVNTLTGLLKKSERGKFEALSLKLILEETLPLVQFQTYLENLTGTEVVFDVPAGLPLIKGDLERLQEVFLNLFINAYHAMEGKRDRKIVVTAHEDPAHPAMVLIEFADNGSGMSDEVMKKVFNYGFTTKPAGKGSGMGLYMCRYIIELHGGEVKVRSKLGGGTTFVITLPIYYEPTSFSAGESAIQ
ncbi:MAG: GAF domain-containing sensor histidine kinase [Candidatus Omnitrophica bacterium]|nr:GAF domain-containing sensor histidine kinase [Candidatus Omnitrophota bacterium]